MHIQGLSVKHFRTSKRCRVHPDDLKSYNNVGLEKLFRRGRWRFAKILRFRSENRHVTPGCEISRMANYTNAELVHMDLPYGAEDCCEPAAQCGTISDEAYSQ